MPIFCCLHMSEVFKIHPALLFSENPAVDYLEDKNARELLKEIKSIIENYLAESPPLCYIDKKSVRAKFRFSARIFIVLLGGGYSRAAGTSFYLSNIYMCVCGGGGGGGATLSAAIVENTPPNRYTPPN